MEVSGKKSSDVLSASQLHASDDVRLHCQPCDKDGSLVPAYGYCQDCAEHLCESCYKVHLTPTPLRNHILLDSSKMPLSQQQSPLPAPTDLTEKCQLHTGKIIEYFCRDHNILGCSPCITINHRACNIDYIPDASKNYDASQEYQNLLDTLKTLHTSCRKLAQLATDNKKKIQENQDAIKEEIRKFRQEIDCILDNWETEAARNVEELFGEESVRADSIDTESSKSAKEIEDLQNELKKSQQSRKLNELFIKAKKNEGKMKNYATSISKMQDNSYINNATFKQNSTIQRIIKSEKSLGEFSFEKDKASYMKMPLVRHSHSNKTKREAKHSDQQHESASKNVDSQLLLQQPLYKQLTEPAELQQQASQQPLYKQLTEPAGLQQQASQHPLYKHLTEPAGLQQQASQQPLYKHLTEPAGLQQQASQHPLYKHLTEPAGLQQQASQQPNLTYDNISATFSGQIEATVSDDTAKCEIRGIAVISRDLLAVTDYSNSKVKLVDTVQKKVVSSMKMSTRPQGVAALPGDQLAVTLPGSQIIQVLSTSGGLSKVRQVEVDGYCYGLAYSDGHFVVGFYLSGTVQIMTSDGKVLRTICNDKAGNNMFTFPWYVTVDENNKAVYVSDTHSKGRGVTRLNWAGEVTGVYNDSKLSGPHGILVLADGSLLVCYRGDDTIQLVSPDFTKSRMFLQKKDELSYPWSVGLDREQNKLYVGSYNLVLYEMK